MRKFIRSILNHRAKKNGIKPSKWVHRKFEQMQIKKYGEHKRAVNKAKGTHKKHTWRNRVDLPSA